MFVFTTSTVILRSRILPRWLAIFGYVLGFGMFVMPILFRPVGVAFPVWVFVVSVVIVGRRPRDGDTDRDSGVDPAI